LEEVLQGVAEEMAELVEVDTCAIFDWDTSNDLLKQRLLYAPQANPHLHEELQLRESFDPAEYPLTRQVLTSNKPVQVQPEDLNGDNSPSPLLEQAQIQSALLLPMVMHDQPIGLVMLMDTKQVRFFSQQEIDFAQMLANQTAFAVQNARLYEEAQRQLKVSALLNEASKVINSTLDTNEILQSILAQMNELLNAEAISIALVDKQRNELVYEVAEGIGSDKILGLRLPSNQGVSGWVMEHGRPALVQDTRNDPRFYRQADKRTGHDTTAMVCAPLQVKGEVLGTIQAINPKQGTFTENDLQLMVNLANLAGSALANAQQFARTQAAEARYLSLFADSVNPIVLTDPAGIIVEANRRAFDFFGYERDELIGLLIQHLHVSGELKDRLPRLSTIGYERAETFGGEICTKGQQTIPIEGYVKRTRSGDSELLQWMYRDISQQVELEQMREDLMAMLIHDLQAPLGNIISSLELMRYELTSAPDTMLASIVDIAARSGRRLQTLIRSLLDINHLEAGHPVTDVSFVDINALIAEARELILPTLERRQVELVIDVPPDLSDLFVDRDMVSRIFVNLLDNASKYTPERKQVTVKVRPAEDEELVKVELSDQGPGIPPQFRDAIFEKFRRLQGKNMPKGMGLGLAFCRLAVEAHGGSIWVDDAPGGGARFNFTLPTTEAALQQTRSD
jgi:PAS domain S-box-containing protein